MQIHFIETNGSLVITEQKFEEFDIKTLVEYSLLRNEYNKSSNNIYIFTRAVSRSVKDKNSYLFTQRTY